MINKKIILSILCFSCIVYTSIAQEDARTLLYFIDTSSEAADAEVTTALINRVIEEVEILGFDRIDEPLTVYRGGDAQNSSDFRLESYFNDISEESADLVIATIYSVLDTNIFVQYIIYDPTSEVGVGGGDAQSRLGITLYSTINEAVLELRTYLENYLEDRYTYEGALGKVESIFMQGSQEGVDVFLAGRYVGRISNSQLQLPFTPLPVGSLVSLELRKEGYHTKEFEVLLDSPNVSIVLPELWPLRSLASQVYWTLGFTRGFGLALKTYVSSSEFASFLQFSFHFHEATYTLNPQDISVDPTMNTTANFANPIHNYDFSFLFGQYIITPPDFFVRFSIGLGFGVIKTTIISQSIVIDDFNDVYLNIGNPTLEFNFGVLQLFIRTEFKYLLGISNNLLGRNWLLSVAGSPPISIGLEVHW